MHRHSNVPPSCVPPVMTAVTVRKEDRAVVLVKIVNLLLAVPCKMGKMGKLSTFTLSLDHALPALHCLR